MPIKKPPEDEIRKRLNDIITTHAAPSLCLANPNWVNELHDLLDDLGVSVEDFCGVSENVFHVTRSRLRIRTAQSRNVSVDYLLNLIKKASV